jgi:transcriptional regulator GlxA family with amidase domain
VQIAVLLFEGLTALDAIGPYEVLRSVPGWEVKFVAKESGPQRTDSRATALVADAVLEDVTDPDVVLVPGGYGNRALLDDERVLGWLRHVDERTKWTTSVCTGSLVLGAAGLLEGKRATSHWIYLDALAGYGADPTPERVVRDGKVWTAAGVSSGIDMALALVGEEVGPELAQAVQLAIEYDPEPPFDAGSPKKAPKEIADIVRQVAAQEDEGLAEAATKGSR